MYVIIVDTMAGYIKKIFKSPSSQDSILFGLESRMQVSSGIFLGFKRVQSLAKKTTKSSLIVMEMNQGTGDITWSY